VKRNFKIISVVGPIGVGKSTAARELAASLAVPFLPDPERFVHKNLLEFYKDRRANALSLQTAFRRKRLEELLNLSAKARHCPAVVLDYFFDNETIFSGLNLTRDEMHIYRKVCKSCADVPQPDLVIYLKASPGELIRRIKLRASPMDTDITADYVEEVARAFENYMKDYKKAPVLTYDTRKCDFSKGGKDAALLAAAVRNKLRLQ